MKDILVKGRRIEYHLRGAEHTGVKFVDKPDGDDTAVDKEKKFEIPIITNSAGKSKKVTREEALKIFGEL